ncbi:MAG: ABC transporter permease [Gemmataceae bacterium]|nr:ABC transporter permease [Gemmataceae bacterium]MDW8242298.1 ABC transporter permease [Thermogemmata sp.]
MMYGLPVDFVPTGYDPSLFMLAGYLLGLLATLILGAIVLGILTLPAFFLVLFGVEQLASVVAHLSGAFAAKLVVIMFRGLRRAPLRTSLTYVALFSLTFVLCLIYAVLFLINYVTAEKEANFKAIVTHKTLIPSQMPPGYYEEFKRVCLEELPPELRPVNGDLDLMSWSFVLTTTDKTNPRRDALIFLFALEPNKVLTMMDGLEELTGDERQQLQAAADEMMRNPQAIVMSKRQLKTLNLQVGQRVKSYGMNYPNLTFEFEIIGELPEGRYEGVAFMNRVYLLQLLDAYRNDRTVNKTGEPHPMAEKCVNLMWVRLPNRMAFERLSALINDPKYFGKVPIKMETASSGIGSWLAAYKDIFWGMKYILVPAMIAIMSLVVANAISISVRERRTEMAVLKVLGFQPRHVLALVLGEALLVGFLAGIMSSGLAWGALGSFKFQIMFFGSFFVPVQSLIYAPALGMTVAVAGSIGPAWNAKNVKVAEVFARLS